MQARLPFCSMNSAIGDGNNLCYDKIEIFMWHAHGLVSIKPMALLINMVGWLWFNLCWKINIKKLNCLVWLMFSFYSNLCLVLCFEVLNVHFFYIRLPYVVVELMWAISQFLINCKFGISIMWYFICLCFCSCFTQYNNLLIFSASLWSGLNFLWWIIA
jgi:hypothetical protein